MEKMNWGEEPNFFGPRDYYRNSLLINEISSNKKNGNLLDFGCGSGNLLTRLDPTKYSLNGIDDSVMFIEHLRQNSAIDINLIHGDESTLNNKKNEYDIIVSGETLEHIENDKRTIRIFYSALKKDGVCVISVPAHMFYWDWCDVYARHFRRYSKEELIQKFEETGFEIVKCYYYGFPMSLTWHKLVMEPLLWIRSKTKINYTNKLKNKFLIDSKLITNTLSNLFKVDGFFNWTKLGIGLILVVKKTHD